MARNTISRKFASGLIVAGAFFYCFLGSETASAVKSVTKRSKLENSRSSHPATLSRTAPKKISVESEIRFYRRKLNIFVGINIAKTSAIAFGGQLGVALGKSTPLYFGPEVNFSLFSPGSILATLVGAWYELRVYGSPRLSMGLGLVAGPAFTSSIPSLSKVTYEAFFDGVLAQDIDDFVSVRGQFRPGLIGGIFSFMMNFTVSFRFL